MLMQSQQQTADQHSIFAKHQQIGKIKPLCCWYYSCPQLIVFVPTYIVAIFLSILMIVHVFNYGYHIYIGRTLCIYILYRYISIAFSNPGLARQNPIKILENHRFCTTCNIHVRKFTRHCQICEVCVEAYDHHCVFIGKCVGGGNMGQFKEFLCLMFGTLIYGLVVSVMNINNNIQQVGGAKI